MSEFTFNACLESLEADDYAAFKDAFDLDSSAEEAEYLLRVAVTLRNKFVVEYILGKRDIPVEQLEACQLFATSGDNMEIFWVLSKKLNYICSGAWGNLFNVKTEAEIREVLNVYGTPEDDLVRIIQFALDNREPEVHELAFEKLYKPELIKEEEARERLVESISSSGSLDLLDRIEGTESLKKSLEEKRSIHNAFIQQLSEYTDLVYNNTPDEKIAQAVKYLNLIDEVQAMDQSLDVIIQDYFVHEERGFFSRLDDVSDNCREIHKLLEDRELILFSVSDIKPCEYKMLVKDELGSKGILELSSSCGIYDGGLLYVCYIVEQGGNKYISSQPLIILESKKSLIRLGLRKALERKQQPSKKKAKGKKNSTKAKLTTKELFKFLLAEHMKCRKENGDSL